MNVKRAFEKLLPVVGITGIAYGVGFIVETAHFRMLGVRIPILDPVTLLGTAGEFVINSVRILLASSEYWLYFLIVIFAFALWYYKKKVAPKALVERAENIKGVRKIGPAVHRGTMKMLLVVTVFVMLFWVVVFVVPIMDFDGLLMITGGSEYSGSALSLFGAKIHENLVRGETEQLENYYRYHLYVILLGVLILGFVPLGKKATQESSKGKALGQLSLEEIFRIWPRYIRKALYGVILLHVFLSPVAYGIIAREPNFSNVIVVIDPQNVQYDDILGLNESFKYGQDNYLLYQDTKNTYLYSIETREVTVLNTSSIYAMIHISRHESQSLLALVQRD